MTTIAIIGAVWYFLSYRTGGRGIKGGDGGMSTFNPFVSKSIFICIAMITVTMVYSPQGSNE
jgi:hypothetical protein